jgi:DNA-binding response OmpR family regulator
MSAYRFDRLKVLVIDDNQHMRALVSAILQAFGVRQVDEAADASIGWQMLKLKRPDIVIVDWVLEGMSGIEFTERVRTGADSPNPFVPIVMLTGHTQTEKVHVARDAGVHEFLAKPVSAKAILSRLVSIIEYPRPFVRTKMYFGPCRRRRRVDDYHGPERRLDGTSLAPAPEVVAAAS